MTDEELIEMHWPELNALTRALESMHGTYGTAMGAMAPKTTVNVTAITTANAKDIADEVAWAMRTTAR